MLSDGLRAGGAGRKKRAAMRGWGEGEKEGGMRGSGYD